MEQFGLLHAVAQAACFQDGRDPDLIEHTVRTLVMQRIVAIALGYEDLNDHDQLRRDPVLATLAGKLTARRKGCEPLAGKSTLNRLEHAPETREGSRYHKISHDPAATTIYRIVMPPVAEQPWSAASQP